MSWKDFRSCFNIREEKGEREKVRSDTKKSMKRSSIPTSSTTPLNVTFTKVSDGMQWRKNTEDTKWTPVSGQQAENVEWVDIDELLNLTSMYDTQPKSSSNGGSQTSLESFPHCVNTSKASKRKTDEVTYEVVERDLPIKKSKFSTDVSSGYKSCTSRSFENQPAPSGLLQGQSNPPRLFIQHNTSNTPFDQTTFEKSSSSQSEQSVAVSLASSHQYESSECVASTANANITTAHNATLVAAECTKLVEQAEKNILQESSSETSTDSSSDADIEMNSPEKKSKFFKNDQMKIQIKEDMACLQDFSFQSRDFACNENPSRTVPIICRGSTSSRDVFSIAMIKDTLPACRDGNRPLINPFSDAFLHFQSIVNFSRNCTADAISACTELLKVCEKDLIDVISDLKAPRAEHRKDYISVTLHNWWLQLNISDARNMWCKNEIRPELRLSLAYIGTMMQDLQDCVLKAIEINIKGHEDHEQNLKKPSAEEIPVNKLSFQAACKAISPREFLLEEKQLTFRVESIFSSDTDTPPLADINSSPVEESDQMDQQNLDADHSQVVPFPLIHPPHKRPVYVVEDEPEEDSSGSLSPQKVSKTLKFCTPPSDTGSDSIGQSLPRSVTSSKISNSPTLYIKNIFKKLCINDSTDLSNTVEKDDNVENDTECSLPQNKFLLLDLISLLIDTCITHPESHLLEGIVCAAIDLLGHLTIKTPILQSSHLKLCQTFCLSFSVKMTPNIILHLLRIACQFTEYDHRNLFVLCPYFEAVTSSNEKCNIKQLIRTIEFLVKRDNKKDELDDDYLPQPEFSILESAHYPPKLAPAPRTFLRDVLVHLLKWIESILQVTRFYAPWTSTSENAHHCTCFDHIFTFAVNNVLVDCYEHNFDIAGENELILLNIFNKMNSHGSYKNLLNEKFMDVGFFIFNLLKKNRDVLSMIQVHQAEQLLEKYKAAEYPALPARDVHHITQELRIQTIPHWASLVSLAKEGPTNQETDHCASAQSQKQKENPQKRKVSEKTDIETKNKIRKGTNFRTKRAARK